MSLPDLAAVLWRQRELLDRLAFRLECEQLLLASARTGRLAVATTEVESALTQLQVVELQRAAVSDQVCRELGLPLDASLEDIAAAAQPPWTEVMLEQRNALVSITGEIGALAEASKSISAHGLAAVEAMLSGVGARVGVTSKGYDARGRTDVISGQGRSIVDRAL